MMKRVSNFLPENMYWLKWWQITWPALEHDEADRAAYKMLIGEHFKPEHLVFADESHFNRLTLRRSYAWSPHGSRARRRDFFIRGQKWVYKIHLLHWQCSKPIVGIRYCLQSHLMVSYTWKCWATRSVEKNLLAFSVDYWTRCNLGLCQIQFLSWTTWVFIKSLESLSWWKNSDCSPFLSIHYNDPLLSSGMCLIYLPAYSLDLNPIEEAFSAIKAWLRTNCDYIAGEMESRTYDLYMLIWQVVYGVVTPEKAYGWYKHSEYIA